MKIISPSFENNQTMPVNYTCDGGGINPPLEFSDIPEKTQSLALFCTDPDAPSGDFIHWVIFNMKSNITTMAEGQTPAEAIIARNSTGKNNYVPPCPPSGTHRYIFKLYALDTILSLDTNATKKDIEEASQNHILDESELIGLYKRS